jgi:hypothetical protein
MQGKPDQYVTRIPRSVRIWFQTIHISHGQCVATFRLVLTRSKQAPTPEEILATADRLAQPSPRVTSSFLPHDRLSVGERGFGKVVTQLHRLTGSIYQHVNGTFNTCSRGPTHRSLTDTGGGLQPSKGPARSQVVQSQHSLKSKWCRTPIADPWSFDHSASMEAYVYA